MTQTLTDDTTEFLTELAREEVAAKTIRAYRSDLTHFGRWFAGSTGDVRRLGGGGIPAATSPEDGENKGQKQRAQHAPVRSPLAAGTSTKIAVLAQKICSVSSAGDGAVQTSTVQSRDSS